VEAARKAELAFQVSGLLVRLPVKEGQHVAKGQVLGQLRPDEFQARLESVQGQLDQAQAALAALRLGERPEEQIRREAQVRATAAKLANAKTEFDRYGRLVQSSAVSRAEYELAETSFRVAGEEHKAALQLLEKGTVARKEDIQAQEAQVRTVEGRVEEAALQLRDSTLRAPYAGVIAQRLVEEGQTVTAGKPVIQFQNVDEVDVVVDVPEAVMASDIRSAALVNMSAELSGVPGRKFPVRIKEIAQTADPTTQTFQVRLSMKGTRGVMALPGMTATVTAAYRRTGALARRMLVPISAVSKQENGDQVAWVIGTDQCASRRRVQIGAPTGNQIEIITGLRPGDRVVVAGASFMREGMKVRDLGNALGDRQP
jgi:RND family efflux transporter MFP subunit